MNDDYHCEKCRGSFQRREHYERHLRTHTKEKPFTCSECAQDFSRPDSLARHLNSLHGGTGSRRQASAGQRDRGRVRQACRRCGLSKVRCDGRRPCHRCHDAGAECFYDSHKRKGGRKSTAQPTGKRSLVANRDTTTSLEPLDSWVSNQKEIPVPNSGYNYQSSVSHSMSIGTPPVPLPAMGMDSVDLPSNGVTLRSSLVCTATERLNSGRMPAPALAAPNLNFDAWLNDDMDFCFPSSSSLQNPELEILNNVWFQPTEPDESSKETLDSLPDVCTFTTTSPLSSLYSRSHTPGSDPEAVGVREYHPISIEVDAPLSFPDMGNLSAEEIENESLAHVPESSTDQLEMVSILAHRMQTSPTYPPFLELRFPSSQALNAWIQLYFEHFHPIFPVLHKASISDSETHWLLVFTVAAIGAQFSGFKNAQICANAMRELIRRQIFYLVFDHHSNIITYVGANRNTGQCEQRNQNSRELGIKQAITLNNIAMMNSGDRRALEVAEILQTVPVAIGRRMGLFNDVLSHERIMNLQLPRETHWRLWAYDEERRRAGFGIWLLDAAFENHLDLTSAMNVDELKNTLPQSDDRWNAATAQSWAAFPPGLESSRNKTIGEVHIDGSWLLAWSKTGTIGKQVILQHLMKIVKSGLKEPAIFGPSNDSRAQAASTLESLLSVMDESSDEVPTNDLKALIANKVMCLTALMIHNCPPGNSSAVALKYIYGHLDTADITKLSFPWMHSPHHGRSAVFYAARVFETVRSNYTTHFSTPNYLLRAILVLWIYSLLYDRIADSPSPGSTPSSVVIGTSPLSDPQMINFVENGTNRLILAGIGNILSYQGRIKFLDEAGSVMGSLKGWAIRKPYANLLKRLRFTEAP